MALYEPLDQARREIRLLSIDIKNHGDEHDDIRCTIVTKSLDDVRGQHETLSYVWGQKRSDGSAHVNSQAVHLTVSLETFLREWRRRAREAKITGPPLPIWVDAICLDQKDDLELSAQVGMMSNIYQSARGTVA